MTRQLRILFLEDRPADFELELHELQRDGADITAVRVDTEDEYVRQLGIFAPDIILADYALPSYDGLSALETARRTCQDIPFIFVSGAMGEEIAVDAPKHGATDYVLKQRLMRLWPAVQRAICDAAEKKTLGQAEQKLRDSESLYHSLVENLHQRVFRKDISGRLTFVNDQLCHYWGKSAEEFLGKTSFDLYPPELAEQFEDQDRQVMETGEAVETVVELPSEGATRFMQLVKTPLHDAQHQIIGVQGIAWDITKSKHAEARIRHLNQLLRAIRDINSLMVKQRDPRKLLQHACEILVHTRGYLLVWIGETEPGSTQVIPVARAGPQEDYVDEITVTLNESRTGQGPIGKSIRNRELRIVNNVATDPTFEPWRKAAMARGYGSVASFPLILGSKNAGALAVYADRPGAFDSEEIDLLNELAADLGYALRGIKDETERNLLQKEFLQAQKMEAIGRLTGGIAHDFNNLLTIIIGCSSFLLSDIPPDNPVHADAEQINRAGTRAAELTSKLLAFSRKQILQPRVLDLNAAVQDNSKLLLRLIGEDIDLLTIPTPDLGCIKADQTQIEQVIMNLAVNARDAMPDGGKLTLETANVDLDQSFVSSHRGSTMGAFVMLAVKDIGTGMDSETKQHLFEPFFTTKEEGKGTGLGLATVYGIVKQSGGYITVDSAPGCGTTFRIYFPRVDEAAEKIKTAPIREAEGSETILVVEDMEEVRALAVRALQARGYEALEARDGHEALAVASEHTGRIDLVATDMILPGDINGRELAGRLVIIRPGIKVLYISGYAGVFATSDFVDPNLAFLPKPYRGEDLARKVREVLQKNTSGG